MWHEDREHEMQISALAALAEFCGKPIRRVTYHRLDSEAEEGLI